MELLRQRIGRHYRRLRKKRELKVWLPIKKQQKCWSNKNWFFLLLFENPHTHKAAQKEKQKKFSIVNSWFCSWWVLASSVRGPPVFVFVFVFKYWLPRLHHHRHRQQKQPPRSLRDSLCTQWQLSYKRPPARPWPPPRRSRTSTAAGSTSTTEELTAEDGRTERRTDTGSAQGPKARGSTQGRGTLGSKFQGSTHGRGRQKLCI